MNTPVPDAVRPAHDSFLALAENAPDIIARFDTSFRHLYVNPRVVQATGRNRDEFLGRTNRELGMPEHLVELWDEAMRDVVRTRDPVALQFEFETAEGLRAFDARWVPEFDEHGVVCSLVCVTRDITEQRLVEKRLRESEARFRLSLQAHMESEHRLRTILDTTPAAIIAIDNDRRVRLWNRGAEALFGWSADEVLDQPLPLRTGEGTGLSMDETFAAADEGRMFSGEQVQRLDRNGRALELSIWNAPLLTPAGERAGIVAVFVDQTERFRLEEQLRQSQKIEAIGRLAGGVAHDFNNVLTTVLGHADLVLASLDARDPVRGDIEEIRAAAARASGLTRQLLAFGRKQMLSPRVLDLGSVVTDMHRMLRRIIGEDIELATDVEPGLWSVKVDRSQMEQVLLNLAVNARDAMPSGGALSIRLSNRRGWELARIDPSFAPIDSVVLEVGDTGAGIPPELVERIFEPFFTTKPQGQGTGLGLATVHGIIAQSGGHIVLRSTPGTGTTFIISLPRTEEADDVPGTDRRAGPDAARATILLIEDESGVRSLAQRILSRAGHHVITATNGEDAVLFGERHATRIDVVVSDLVMPGIGGRETVDRLRQLLPSVAIVLMSGYSEDMLQKRGGLNPGEVFLAKPFTADALVDAVTRARASRPGLRNVPRQS